MTGDSWWLVAAGVAVVLVLVAVAFWLGRRGREQRAAAGKSSAPSGGWREVSSKLPASARALPLVVVLGERGAGKTRLVEHIFGRDGFTGQAVTARDDFRVSAFAVGPVLVQEVAGELFEAEGSDGLVQLHDLWQNIALEIALVVFVGPMSTPAERQATRIRRILELLTDLRGGSPPRSCVCVTRLDESAEGFAELVFAAEQAGVIVQRPVLAAKGEELEVAWNERLRDGYYQALATLSASDFARAARFFCHGAPQLVRYVDELLRGVARGQVRTTRSLVALAALPEAGNTALFGDPFAPDHARLDEDRRALERKRLTRSALLAAALSALIFALYVGHAGTLREAERAVSAFGLAAARARGAEPELASVMTAELEAQANSAIAAALRPLYPPLRYAFPDQKEALTSAFVHEVRRLHVEPRTLSPDRAERVYAASLLYASRGNALGGAVRKDAQRWAVALGIPLESIQCYVELSRRPFAGRLSAAEFGDHDVSREEWGAFFERLDAVMARGRLERPEELSELRALAERLDRAMLWAVQEPELRWLIRLLELERGKPEVERLLGGKSAALLQAPPWVVAQRDAIRAAFSLVRTGDVAVPPTAGKSLRQVLVDLERIGVPSAATPGPAVTLKIDGTQREYRPEAWAKLLSESRALLYMDALLRDLTARPLFFSDPSAYPDIPPSPVFGRGPSAPISGIYTPVAFKTEIKEPIAALDGKLEAAGVESEQRAALKAVVERELTLYAVGLGQALSNYLRSFRFEVSDASLLRSYLADLASGASWFTEFWANLAASAAVDAGDTPELLAVRRAVAAFSPVTALMTGDKGAYPNLEPYGAIVVKLLPALVPEPLFASEQKSGPLAERLPALGKLGLVLLDAEKPGPLQEVEDWLTKNQLLDEALREPFRAPVRAVYEQALRSVERTAATAYTQEMRPLVAPFFSQFPFDPNARVEAVPGAVQAVLGPKGSFVTLFQDIYGALMVRDQRGHWQPRKVPGYRALSLSREALELGRWATTLSQALWDESGAPRAMPLMVRPVPLAKISAKVTDAPTLALLRSGSTAVAAFNQATTWKPLSVEWWTSSPTSLSLELTSLDGTARRAVSAEAPGTAWRFFRLLRQGSWSSRVVRWALDRANNHEVAFELSSNPWELLVPPVNRDRAQALTASMVEQR